jgi:tetratricopeptide (TPR) repeat protein/energy-coupling factor transporter ATP-binding protein EcfA2
VVSQPHPVAAAETFALDLEHLPFPVAHPLSFALDASLLTEKRLSNTVFASYQAMRLVGLILLADYFACSVSSPSLASAIRGLRTPHWYEWSMLCDKLAAFWSGEDGQARPERETHFPALVRGWKAVNRKKGGLPAAWASALENLPGLEGPARNPNDALWKARNDLAHRRGTRTAEEAWDRDLLARLLPLAQIEAETLFPTGTITLVRALAKDPLRGIHLTGPHQELRFLVTDLSPAWSSLFEHTEVAALAMGSGIPLYPLIVSIEAEGPGSPAITGLAEQIALLEGSRPKQLELLGVRHYHQRPDLIQPFIDALAQKDTSFGLERRETRPWDLPAWAEFHSREALEALRGRKYFPECYLERTGVDDVVAARLQESGKALLLLGEAGSGKSSLLARLAESLLREQEVAENPAAPSQARDTVIFLSGRALTGDATLTGRRILAEAVLARAGIRSGAFSDLTDFAQSLAPLVSQDSVQNRKVWIILDALNEADRFTDLLKALDDFLPSLGRHPWLRLIFSIRSGAWHALQTRHDALARHGHLMGNLAFLQGFRDEASLEEQPFLEIRPFTLEGEGRAAYEKRQLGLPNRAARIPYDSLAPGIRSLLLDPLHLHLFHETYQGRASGPSELEESDLFAGYLDGILRDQGTLKTVIDRIGAWMFEARKPELPLNISDEWIDAWRRENGYESAACVSKLDPIEELVAVSLLLRPTEEGFGVDRKQVAYQFSHQRLCEQVLVRHLMARIAPRTLPTGEEMLQWCHCASGPPAFAELGGAVAILARRMVVQGEGVALVALLDFKDPGQMTSQVLGAAIRALGPAWGPDEKGRPEIAALPRALEKRLHTNVLIWASIFEVAAWKATEWLTRSGFSWAAMAVETLRLDAARRIFAIDPGIRSFGWLYSFALRRSGALALKVGRMEEASILFQECYELCRKLAEAEPGHADRKRDLRHALREMGSLARKRGQHEAAWANYAEALAIQKELVEAEPDRPEARHQLAISLIELGTIARTLKKADEAMACFLESLPILRSLVDARPTDSKYKHSLGGVLFTLGDAAMAKGQRAEAWQHYEEGHRLLLALVQVAPSRADRRLDLARALGHLGEKALAEMQGGERKDRGRAEAYLNECHRLLAALLAAEPYREDLRNAFASCQKRLDRLASLGGADLETEMPFHYGTNDYTFE